VSVCVCVYVLCVCLYVFCVCVCVFWSVCVCVFLCAVPNSPPILFNPKSASQVPTAHHCPCQQLHSPLASYQQPTIAPAYSHISPSQTRTLRFINALQSKPARGSKFSSSLNVRTGLGPPSFPFRVLFLVVKQPDREADHTHPPNVDVKNE
jgi:hypothetical protein